MRPGAGPLSWWRASPRRQIDSRTHLLLRTDYCSPFEERVDRRPAGPRSLPLKSTNGTRRLSQARPNCWRFHHDLARRPSDRPIVRGRAILWWFGGRSYPFKVAVRSPSPRAVHGPPLSRRCWVARCRGLRSSRRYTLRLQPLCSSVSPSPSSRTHRGSLTPGTYVFRGLLAPGSTPRTNRLGGGRRRGESLTQMRGCRLVRPRRRRRDQLHCDSRARSLSWAGGGGHS